MVEMIKVTIVIVNYNKTQLLLNCVASVEKQKFEDYNIIIVDNNSNDKNLLATLEKRAKIIYLDNNYGFSKAVNIAIAEADAEYVVLLNNDTEVLEGWLENLLQSIEEDEKIFSCCGKMLQFHSPGKIDDAGDFITVFGNAIQRGQGFNSKRYNQKTSVLSCCGGASIYRKKIWDELGGLDEAYFAYFEDVDIGFRALVENYKNIYCPNAKVLHMGSATAGKDSSFKFYHTIRNRKYFLYKNIPKWMHIVNYIPMSLCSFLYFLRSRDEYKKAKIDCKKMMSVINRPSGNILKYLYIQWLLIKATFMLFIDNLLKFYILVKRAFASFIKWLSID